MTKTHKLETVVSTLEYVPLGKMIVNPRAQRQLRPARVAALAAEMDFEMIGYPVLNMRGQNFYIIDGQHRIEALKRVFEKDWQVQQIQCRVYRGLTEQQEADMFDRLDNYLRVNAFDTFKVRVTAGRPEETAVQRIVESEGLCISKDRVPGSIGAVTALRRVYMRSNAEILGKTLRIIRDAFGDFGFEAQVIDGIGHLCQRYNGVLDEKQATSRLNRTRAGVKGLLGRAEILHKQTGNAKAHCVAAAAVDVINARRGGKKLPSWWKPQDGE